MIYGDGLCFFLIVIWQPFHPSPDGVVARLEYSSTGNVEAIFVPAGRSGQRSRLKTWDGIFSPVHAFIICLHTYAVDNSAFGYSSQKTFFFAQKTFLFLQAQVKREKAVRLTPEGGQLLHEEIR